MKTEQANTSKMKYVTLEEGIDFRRIASIMSQNGYQMNHATARNVLMLALSRLVRFISERIGSDLTDEQVKEILKNQQVHEALCDILFEANKQLELEKV